MLYYSTLHYAIYTNSPGTRIPSTENISPFNHITRFVRNKLNSSRAKIFVEFEDGIQEDIPV